MTPNEMTLAGLTRSSWILHQLLDDLTSAEWLTSAVPGSNSIAWTVAHLAAVEWNALKTMGVAARPELPDADFFARHTKGAKPSPTENYGDPKSLLVLWDAVRASTVKFVTDLPAADFDNPLPHPLFKRWGELLMLLPSHTSLHAGQISTARRALGKPAAF
ncbi:MAG: DinB family protein [Tepidisphaeraceae bacterium]